MQMNNESIPAWRVQTEVTDLTEISQIFILVNMCWASTGGGVLFGSILMSKCRNNGSQLIRDNFLEFSRIKVGNKIGHVGSGLKYRCSVCFSEALSHELCIVPEKYPEECSGHYQHKQSLS